MKKSVLFSLMIIGAVAAMITAATSASFTDTATSGGNAFSTGTLDVSASPATTLFTATNMAPGDSIVGALQVTNSGTLAMRYALTGTEKSGSTSGLVANFTLDARAGSASTGCDAAGFATFGSGSIASAKALATGTTNLAGDPTAGAQAGDRYLSSSGQVVDADGTFPHVAGTAAATNEWLCIKMTLNTSTPNSFNVSGTTLNYEFAAVAEQRANNP